MKIYVLLEGMTPVEFFHSLQRAKKFAKERGHQSNCRIIGVKVLAGLFSPLFQADDEYKFTTNWLNTRKALSK